MKHTILSLLLFTISISATSQTLELDWKFEATDSVLASPVIHNETVYVGDQGGVFFALDIANGNEKWRIETDGNIQGKATLVDDNIFFESANIFYLADRKNGKILWMFDPEMEPFNFKYKEYEWPYKIDPYDDKRSTAFLHEGVIYVGCGNGNVYGLNADNGKVAFSYQTEDGTPVRSSPHVSNGILYFGDWEGFVYAYSLENKKLEWKKKTYRQAKPYGTFGGVVSEFLVYDSLLFFGARNFMLNVLDIATGEKVWTYTDAQKGWIIGDPVVYKDTLYIGGSDNYSMLAFDPEIGRPIWSQNGGKNIYTKPIVTEEWVIYTSGNGYNPKDSGIVFLLDRKTGQEISKYELPNGSFSSPGLSEDQLVFGCYDKHIYSLRIKKGS
ncbi:outer membrane protein assembly factor BamB family protein [Ekhidna sp. To15]|uniref:outer membrane protein assembly factor BamB family protein n=1 Tax=Ekhidna sp. To15 TaxID=3395267 RepID=UPI003F527D05